jgi:serine protease Do
MGGYHGRRRFSIWLIVLAVIGLVVSAPTYDRIGLAGIGLAGHELDLIRQAPAPADPVDPLAAVQAGLVQITTNLDYQNAVGNGTGIVLSPTGEVLTNNHVIAGGSGITATSVGTGKTYPVTVIGYDRKHDVALAQLAGATDLPTATLGDSNQLAVGQPVMAIGNTGGTGSPLSHASGPVTGINQTVVADDDLTGSSERLTGLIGVAANMKPGDSGGPLVNNAGQVVGLSTAAAINYRLGTPEGQGFAIPINDALGIAAQIRSGTPSATVHIGDTPMLGVGVSSKPQSAAGVAVQKVLRGGPADQAGISGGDVITAVDGTRVDSATTLTDLLDHHHPGETVTVAWLHAGAAQRSAPIVLAAGPPG